VKTHVSAPRIRQLASGVLALLAITSAAVAASETRLATLDERIKGADDVVVATVRGVTAEWRENEHGDRVIVSRLVLDVDESIKGAGPSTMVLEMEGGTLDGLTLRVSSLPLIQQPGDRAVFFLDNASRGVYTPHLRGQGILFLDTNDVIRGSSYRVDDVRARARALHQ
jgi:hypothetical protein